MAASPWRHRDHLDVEAPRMEGREARAALLPQLAWKPRLKRITILTGNHLCHNPRVIKEADCLAAAGYDVEVLGGALDDNLADRDRSLAANRAFRYRPAFSLVERGLGGRWARFTLKARRRAAFEA